MWILGLDRIDREHWKYMCMKIVIMKNCVILDLNSIGFFIDDFVNRYI